MTPRFVVVCAGNVRTFLQCFDSHHKHLLSRLPWFHVYFYLKLNDPGPKGQQGWDYEYAPVTREDVVAKIREHLSDDRYTLDLLDSDEHAESELIASVADRSKYVGFFGTPATHETIDPEIGPVKHLSRAMNCHYNLHRCGVFLAENLMRLRPDFVVYTRPDLEFFSPFQTEAVVSRLRHEEIVLFNRGPNHVNIDHFAVIPLGMYTRFFFDRFLVYLSNRSRCFEVAENVYNSTVEGVFDVEDMLGYHIRR